MNTRPNFVILLLVSAVSLCLGQGSGGGTRCTTPKGGQGNCINLRQCEPLLTILRNHRNEPGATDHLKKSMCGYQGRDPLVCCPEEQGLVNNQPDPGPGTQNNAGDFPALPDSPECGYSNVTHIRVVGGDPARPGAWPWIVALGYKAPDRSNNKAPRFLCGASLITKRHVLTAAHCVYNRPDLYFARIGDLDLQSDKDQATPIDIPIINKKVHEKYSPTQFTNDIAILTLKEDVKPSCTRKVQSGKWGGLQSADESTGSWKSIYIRPVCLPTTPQQRTESYDNLYPFIAGWGAQNFSGPSSSQLLEVQLPVVKNAKCKQAFSRFKSAVIDERVLCAGFETGGKDACQGDSGGPLVMPDARREFIYYQIGVVSYGYRCAEPGIPGVYTRITAFLDWISDNVQ